MNRFAPLAFCVLASPAAAQLDLTLVQTTDLSTLVFSPGGGAFDPVTKKLWLSEAGATGNAVYEVDPLTGVAGAIHSATIIPSFFGGPDAMALQPGSGNLYLFSAFGQDECGAISQAGQLVLDLPSAHGATAAAFDPAGRLFVFSDNSLLLHQIDPSTGALLTSVTLEGFIGSAAAMAFDPATGHLIVLAASNSRLIEFDPDTGARHGVTPLAPFGVSLGVVGLMAFNEDGSQLYVAKASANWGLDVFDRGSLPTTFCLGDGTGALCPCGNFGAAGQGCANSTGSGATLGASGTAQVGVDSLVLEAAGAPPAVFGVFFGGGAEIAPAPFGDGLSCVGGGIQRLGAPLRTDANGQAQSAVTISVVEGLTGGETRHYQFWYRDTSGPCGQGFNASHAAKLTW